MSLNSAAQFEGRMPKPADGKVPEALKCAKCGGLLFNAMLVTECGCRLCESPCCKELFANGKKEAMCPGRTEDCTMFSSALVDKGTRRNVMNMDVACIYNCGHTGVFRELGVHLNKCPLAPVLCRFCKKTYPARDIEAHIQICPNRLVPCRFCSQEIPIAAFPDHHNLLSDSCCSNYIDACPHCKKVELKRHDVEAHKTVCPKWPVECPFLKIGCQYQGNDLKAHLNEDIAKHQTLLLNTVMKKQVETQQENEKLRRENEELRTKCRELTDETNELKEEFDQRWQKMRKVQTLLANCREKQIDIDKTVRKYGSVDTLISRFTEAENSPRNFAIPQIDPAVTTYNGIFLWRIDNYRARRTEAKEGISLTVTSPPFFSEPYGYKMCCRLYLNGDGSGRGTHLSMFIVLMKSEFDSVLKWPFTNRVTFTLLNQDNPADNVVETFSPDQRSNSFRKPVDEMNIASGCPRFILFSRLEGSNWSSPYLREDTIFIRTQIDRII